MPDLTSPGRPTLHYRDWGSPTARPVLFLSAWALSSAEFQFQMRHLTERHGLRTLAYDRRGHGRSDDPGRGYDYDTLADDLAALIDHLDLRDLTLVAHSMAGGEAVRYLTRHGADRIDGLVLLAATLPFPTKTINNPYGMDRRLIEDARAQWRTDLGQWLEDNQGLYFGDGLPGCAPVSQRTRDWTLNDMLSTSLQAVLDCNATMIDTDFRDELRTVDVPTLIVQGDHDASVPLEFSGTRQHQLLPDSRLVVYPNAPHGFYLTHAERLNADLAAFVLREPQ